MVQIKKHSGIYTLETAQEINIPLHEAWVKKPMPDK